jgi:hypothetical protein
MIMDSLDDLMQTRPPTSARPLLGLTVWWSKTAVSHPKRCAFCVCDPVRGSDVLTACFMHSAT